MYKLKTTILTRVTYSLDKLLIRVLLLLFFTLVYSVFANLIKILRKY